MDRVANYSNIIQRYLQKKAAIPFSPGVALQFITVADTKAHHYLLLTVGEQKGERVHSLDLHIKIDQFITSDNDNFTKVIVDLDNTDWYVRKELEAEGIAAEDMVDTNNPINC